MITIDITKQQALDTNSKSIQQIKCTVNLNRGWNVNDNITVFFIIEETKQFFLDFS